MCKLFDTVWSPHTVTHETFIFKNVLQQIFFGQQNQLTQSMALTGWWGLWRLQAFPVESCWWLSLRPFQILCSQEASYPRLGLRLGDGKTWSAMMVPLGRLSDTWALSAVNSVAEHHVNREQHGLSKQNTGVLREKNFDACLFLLIESGLCFFWLLCSPPVSI